MSGKEATLRFLLVLVTVLSVMIAVALQWRTQQRIDLVRQSAANASPQPLPPLPQPPPTDILQKPPRGQRQRSSVVVCIVCVARACEPAAKALAERFHSGDGLIVELSSTSSTASSLACAQAIVEAANLRPRTVVAIDAASWRCASEDNCRSKLLRLAETWPSAEIGLGLGWWGETEDDDWWLSDFSFTIFNVDELTTSWIESAATLLEEEYGRHERISASVAAREAWWRHENRSRLTLKKIPTTTFLEPTFLDDARPNERKGDGPVGRFFGDPGMARLREPSSWRPMLDAILTGDNDDQPPLREVVVVTGADVRYASTPKALSRLPTGRLSSEAHDAVVVALAQNKRRWATRHGYGFEFVVTNSLGRALRGCGLRHWEFAKAFALVAAAHSASTRARADALKKDVWLLWLDHDTWINPRYFPEGGGKGRDLNEYLSEIPSGVSAALSNFRSLNTGVVLIRLDERGRKILFDWLLAVVDSKAECQPYDQAALQYVLLTRLNESADERPFGFSCRRPECGGTPEKHFGMCNPNFYTACDAALRRFAANDPTLCLPRGMKRKHDSPKFLPPCGDAIDRGAANAVINPKGFHVLPSSRTRPRLQCFQPRSFDNCQLKPGANFPPVSEQEDRSWLFAHKSIDIFFDEHLIRSRRRRRRR